MKQIALFRAQGICDEDVTEVTIVIAHPMPDLPAEKSHAFFASEAAALADALWSSLPGGTIDALTGAMLARRASLLRVPMPTPGGTS